METILNLFKKKSEPSKELAERQARIEAEEQREARIQELARERFKSMKSSGELPHKLWLGN